MAIANHFKLLAQELTFNQKLAIKGGRKMREVMELLCKGHEEWDVADLPSPRQLDRWRSQWLSNAPANPNYIDWTGFDTDKSIGKEDHQIPWADARTALDFYGFYASEAVRNFEEYNIDKTKWHPTLGLIKACVAMSYYRPDQDIYTQAMFAEREWVHHIFMADLSLEGKVTNDHEQLSVALRSWNYPSNTAQGRLIHSTLEELAPTEPWDLNGTDDKSRRLRQTAIGQMPLYRYNRLSNGESFYSWRRQYQAELTRSERQESITESELPIPAASQRTAISWGIDEIRELLPNLNREQRLALANEIWNEV